MDPILKFLNIFAYKFPKGYPDINNKQDVLLLESLFEKLGINLRELTIDPDYKAKGVFNPFYTIDSNLDSERSEEHTSELQSH
mgnify:CR=1 FL=1